MMVYFDVGLPEGYNTVIVGKTFTLEPRLVSVSPNVGSVGGSVLMAKIEGLGPLLNTSDAYWKLHGGTLVDNSNGADLCESVVVYNYSNIACTTKPGVVTNGTLIGAKSFESNSIQACNDTATNGTACLYEALTTGTFPTVTSISNTVSGQIVFTGTNFFTAAQNYTASASYGGALADSVTVDSATQVTA